MSSHTEDTQTGLRKLADLGREIERRRPPDPYPRPTGPAPTLDQLRRRREEITRVAALHGAREVRIFGSVARGEAGPESDVDVLLEMEPRGLFEQAALQRDLEELLGCHVHVVTAGGLRHARNSTRQRIAREAVAL